MRIQLSEESHSQDLAVESGFFFCLFEMVPGQHNWVAGIFHFSRKGAIMFSLRGDAHKVFLRLKKTMDQGHSIKHMKELIEIGEIQNLYRSLDSGILKLIFYRMTKEKNGSGIIPIIVSSVPWLMLLFSKQLSDFLFHDGSLLWVVFSCLYIFAVAASVILHFREKAWAAFHMEIIKDILNERKDEEISGHSPV